MATRGMEVTEAHRQAVLEQITSRGPVTLRDLEYRTRGIWQDLPKILKAMVADGTIVREVVIEADCVRRATFRLPCATHHLRLSDDLNYVGDYVRCTHCGKRWVA